MYKISLKAIQWKYLQIRLIDKDNKSIKNWASQSDINIHSKLLEWIDIDLICSQAWDFLYKMNKNDIKITPSTIYNVFACFWISNSSDDTKNKYILFAKNFGFEFNYLWISNFEKVINITENKLNENSAVSNFLNISWRFMNLFQFQWIEWYYNASSKLISLKDKYIWCDSDIYLDSLYYKQIDKLTTIESVDYQLLKQFKWFSKTNRDNIYNRTKSIFASQNFSDFINRKNIDTMCIIPNNSERPTSANQIIKDICKSEYPTNVQHSKYIYINILKNKLEKQQAQKNIRVFCDRTLNVERLFEIDSFSVSSKTNNILLIDGVFWSGATMNIISQKIKKIKKIKSNINILWSAILGSYGIWFDVINEA